MLSVLVARPARARGAVLAVGVALVAVALVAGWAPGVLAAAVTSQGLAATWRGLARPEVAGPVLLAAATAVLLTTLVVLGAPLLAGLGLAVAWSQVAAFSWRSWSRPVSGGARARAGGPRRGAAPQPG